MSASPPPKPFAVSSAVATPPDSGSELPSPTAPTAPTTHTTSSSPLSTSSPPTATRQQSTGTPSRILKRTRPSRAALRCLRLLREHRQGRVAEERGCWIKEKLRPREHRELLGLVERDEALWGWVGDKVRYVGEVSLVWSGVVETSRSWRRSCRRSALSVGSAHVPGSGQRPAMLAVPVRERQLMARPRSSAILTYQYPLLWQGTWNCSGVVPACGCDTEQSSLTDADTTTNPPQAHSFSAWHPSNTMPSAPT